MTGMATGGGALPSAASLTASPASLGGGAAGGGNVAGVMDLMADDLTFTMDRKEETEQGAFTRVYGYVFDEVWWLRLAFDVLLKLCVAEVRRVSEVHVYQHLLAIDMV